MFLKC